MRLSVVTPEGAKVEAQVQSVTIPGAVGELGILPGHRPLITSLSIGKLSYVTSNRTEYLATNDGYMEVHDDVVTVVTQSAEKPDEIDIARSKASVERAERELREIDRDARPDAWDKAKRRRLRAENRMRVAEMHATPAALKQVRERGE
ncbi:MAG: ATP synthase F1 subunit epsilon [Deltaproteobacteria bacterium]|nr:MAG: ATP synthase F1 subunit epsilon [Deltaproteobacteria bacterium]